MQLDLFVPLFGIADIGLRDIRHTMERPFFALSKSRHAPIVYQSPDRKVRVEVTGNPRYGLATIWDADILIALASAVRHGQARLRNSLSRYIEVMPHELLRLIGRDVGGRSYERLCQALDRLQSTTVKTNLLTGDRQREHTFSWISEWRQVTQKGGGRSHGMVIVLSDWLWDLVSDPKNLLAVDPAYFSITSAYGRWLYRVGRKHAGSNPNGFRIRMTTLYGKSAVLSPLHRFIADIRRIVAADDLPGLHMEIVDDRVADPMIWMIERDRYEEMRHAEARRQAVSVPSPALTGRGGAVSLGALLPHIGQSVREAPLLNDTETLNSDAFAQLLLEMKREQVGSADDGRTRAMERAGASASVPDKETLGDLAGDDKPALCEGSDDERVIEGDVLSPEFLARFASALPGVDPYVMRSAFDRAVARRPEQMPLDYEERLFRFAEQKHKRQRQRM